MAYLSHRKNKMKDINQRLIDLGITVKVKAQDDGTPLFASRKLAGFVGVARDPRQTEAVRTAAMTNVEIWVQEVDKRSKPAEPDASLA